MEETMKGLALTILVTGAAIFAASSALAQQKKVDVGQKEFEIACAICHGADAKGKGFYVPSLKTAPPDLTVLSKNNGGVFPVDRVHEVIDGRAQIVTHGSRDMPIWGTRYAINAAEYYVDVPYDAEAYIRNRVLNLVNYLYQIQQK
jgi:mono/diheme cytochrome c family protein